MCFVSDLRTGAMSGGSPEQALLSAAVGQFAQFYDVTGATASGMTDSKLPDMQAGYERAYNHALVANAGVNMIYESAGMMASLMGFSLDSLVIDNDIIGATQRTIRGIEVSEDALAIEAIRNICVDGPGHFLGSEQTLDRMQRDYLYPSLGDRSSPKEWLERGRSVIVQRARQRLDEVLTQHFPTHLPRAVDEVIRAGFPVRLPREAMRRLA
jgi:trimethylamine--corrinoid protein Co-methyltransferase